MRTLAVTFILAAGISGCAPVNNSTETAAKCIADIAPDGQAFEMGAAVGRGAAAEPSSSILARCAPRSFVDKEYRVALNSALSRELSTRAAFKQGGYSVLLDQQPGPLNRGAFTELALVLETATRVRAATLTCDVSSQEAVYGLSELDMPFTLAVLGERVGVPVEALARKLAADLFTRVSAQAKRLPKLACGEELSNQFKTHAATWLSFYEGRHPWTPNCHAEALDSEVRLYCSPNSGK